jgi:hypothetical protein
MRLYKATYNIEYVSGYWSNEFRSSKDPSSLYILAPDFQAAVKLAETDEKINDTLKSAGSLKGLLFKMELIATDVNQE